MSVKSGPVTSIRSTALFGVSVVALFMGTVGSWASLAPISGAVVASGQVVTDNKTQIVRQERGGVLAALNVREGQVVKAGEILAVIDRVEDKSAREELIARTAALVARERRLMIEQREEVGTQVTVMDVFANIGGVDKLELSRLEALIADQNDALATRRAQVTGTINILQIQKRTLEQEKAGVDGELTALHNQMASLSEDIRLRRAAANSGFGREAALRELERQADTVRGNIIKAETGLVSLQHQSEEIDQKIAATRSDFLQKVSEELSKVRAERLETEEALAGRTRALERVDVRAPMAGIINKVNTNTIGSAIEPYASLVEIVAEDQKATVEVRIHPADIDDVFPGQHARVVLSAFNRHLYDPVSGAVNFVSADARLDEASGQTYYTVRLVLDPEQQKALPPVVPGMPAEAYLLKHDRTFVDYLAEPFIQSFQRAFRQ